MFTFHNSHGKSTVQIMYLHPLFLQQNAIKLNPFFPSDAQKKKLERSDLFTLYFFWDVTECL